VNALYLLLIDDPVYFSWFGVYPALVVLRVFLTFVYFNTVTGWWYNVHCNRFSVVPLSRLGFSTSIYTVYFVFR